MRQIACVLLGLAAGCASTGNEARVRRQAESVVWGAMASPSPTMRERATRITADVADPLLDRGLGARLADPSASVRATAAVALAQQLPAAADVLRQILDGNDAAAKVIAIDAIGAIEDGKARLPALAADADLRVRARAATAIAQWKPEGARALLDKLLRDEDAGVRGQALAALARYGDRSALGEIAAALEDRSLGVRLAALGALVRVGRDAVGDRLLALGAGKDQYVALRAAVQLSHDGRGGAALPAVRAAADDRDPAVRAAAMNAAGELGAAGYPLATAHLGDPDVDVRLAAARATIASGHHDEALPALVGALGTARRLDAADELARLGDARGLTVLQTSARATDPQERRAAIMLLAPILEGRSTLETALGDADAEIRLDAAGALLRKMMRYER
ncbi:MAG TPA: HEAT repeat domain-containing protein [Polyangia bacterium]|nr:HEAT repeat domain-containing protein [Polyangia bacterium]